MRCKACDELLSAEDLRRKNQLTGLHEDLCGSCLNEILPDIISSLADDDPLVLDLLDDLDSTDVLEDDNDDTLTGIQGSLLE